MQGCNVLPVMKTSTTASAIADTEQKDHQSCMEHGHCKADAIHSDMADQTSAILTNLQCNARLIK